MNDILEHRAARVHLEALDRTLHDLERRVIERTGELKLLYEVASAANGAASIEEAFEFVLRQLATRMGWVFGQVFFPIDRDPESLAAADIFYERDSGRFAVFHSESLSRPIRSGQGLVGRVYHSALPEWGNDISRDLVEWRGCVGTKLALKTAAAFPVLTGNHVAAVIEFLSDEELPMNEQLLQSMMSIGTQLGRVVERRMQERRIADAIDEHQRTIGLEMHDSVAQQLTGVLLLAEDLRQQLAARDRPEVVAAGRLVECVQEAQQQVWRLSRGLLPVEVDAHGLMSALEKLCDMTRGQGNAKVYFQCRSDVLVDDNMTATHLFHIAQEALQNAVRHANATRIVVQLNQTGDRIRLSTRDNGVGLPQDVGDSNGIGYRIMRYRARVIGAQLFVRSQPAQGTTVECELRIKPPAGEVS